MKYRARIGYPERQKALMWDRWQKRKSPHKIAACLIVATARFVESWPRPAESARLHVDVPSGR